MYNLNHMYILDSTTNTLQKAQLCKFKDLNLKEREHLQEWIANEPTSLGEDLLIIQKEFDQFSDTRERLDLLALDTKGHLVIIENKLDDSGRDVTWQALKYASYCSSLTKEQIISIFQNYLGPGKDARKILTDFYEVDLDEIELNPENSQRIILVAANFHKEVTSSVLWLANFGLKIKCIKVTPHLYNNRILVDFDQIIPIKDAEEYTIKMASKKQETSQTTETSIQRRDARHDFWMSFIEYNKRHGGLFSSSTGSHDSWLMKALGTSGIAISVIVNKDIIKTEVTINRSKDIQYNKAAFDFLQSYKDEIETSLNEYPLLWLRNNDKVMSNIRTEKPGLSFSNPEHSQEIYNFLMTSAKKFHDVFQPLVRKYKNGLPKS